MDPFQVHGQLTRSYFADDGEGLASFEMPPAEFQALFFDEINQSTSAQYDVPDGLHGEAIPMHPDGATRSLPDLATRPDSYVHHPHQIVPPLEAVQHSIFTFPAPAIDQYHGAEIGNNGYFQPPPITINSNWIGCSVGAVNNDNDRNGAIWHGHGWLEQHTTRMGPQASGSWVQAVPRLATVGGTFSSFYYPQRQMKTPASMASDAGADNFTASEDFEKQHQYQIQSSEQLDASTVTDTNTSISQTMPPHASGSQDAGHSVRGTVPKARPSHRAPAPYPRRSPSHAPSAGGASPSTAGSSPSSSSSPTPISNTSPVISGGARLLHHCLYHPCTGKDIFVGVDALTAHLDVAHGIQKGKGRKKTAVASPTVVMADLVSLEDMVASTSASTPQEARVKCKWEGCGRSDTLGPASIMRHVLTHLDVKFKCPYCKFACTRKTDTKSHIRKKHRVEFLLINGVRVEAHNEVVK
ncbi:hypothetical protein BDZ97DRAFT_1407649 [Flammula alnicola]|nr:hypothetical protein BDZ97DRAFT_1407649 [Flammula alnicola]